MRQPRAKSRNQAGDTIVEVLIAIAIIATILAGAFVLSRNSLKQVRDSEERAQATNLLQGQIEQLRALAASNDAAAKHTVTTSTAGSPFCLQNVAVAAAGTCESMGDTGLYKVQLYKTDETSFGSYKTYTFDGTVTWDSVNGNTSRIELQYKATFE